jgi:hypothetical protein
MEKKISPSLRGGAGEGFAVIFLHNIYIVLFLTLAVTQDYI